MHGEIDRAVEQRLLDLLGEQSLAAGFGERPVENLVAGSADGDELDLRREKPVRGDQPLAHLLRLLERQRAAARADAQKRRSGQGLHLPTSRCYACAAIIGAGVPA